MMIFDQNIQIEPKHNYGYGAKQFVYFGLKGQFLTQKAIEKVV